MTDLFLDAPAPQPLRRPAAQDAHGEHWEDPYAWLRDDALPTLTDSAVRRHLEAENRYTDAVLAPLAPLKQVLRDQLAERIDPKEHGVPWRSTAGTFRWAFSEGAQYPCWYRLSGDEETLILDEPALAKGATAFSLGAFAPSPRGNFLAYAVDRSGSEHYELRYRPLRGGSEAVVHERAAGGVVWAGDESGFFYLIQNDQWRPYQLRWHVLGSDPALDQVLYEESNPGFFLSLDESADGAFLFLAAGDHQTQGQWVLPLASAPEEPLRCLVEPMRGREVEVDHAHGRFWLRSNHEDPDFGVYTVPTEGPWGESNWQPLLPPAPGRYLLGFVLFEGFWARLERLDAQDRILWGPIPEPGALAEGGQAVPFPSALGQAGFGTNAWFSATTLRVSFSSMVDPPAVYDFEPATGILTCLKRRVVPGYAPEDFEQLRFWATSADGTAVPYTVARRRGAPPGPVHLYGYGAYGLGEMPSFSSARVLLMERGVTCVLAHGRGGDELGQRWYRAATEAGREHTFADFLAISEALLADGLGEPGRIALEGGSAGGKLVAVALNRAPDRWAAVFAAVPFVDVLHTMLDPDLPLTPLEWPEWGNPVASREAFDTIRAYCPYQNVRPGAFPPVLATAGVEDPRVGYWEPAKWIAALRHEQRGAAPLLLRTQFAAGHGGATGRYAGLEEIAEAYAFLLTALHP